MTDTQQTLAIWMTFICMGIIAMVLAAIIREIQERMK